MTTRRNSANDKICGCNKHAHSMLASRFPGLPRLTWRDIFRSLGSPASRVHRYRDMHTRLLREALCANDCRSEEPSSCSDG